MTIELTLPRPGDDDIADEAFDGGADERRERAHDRLGPGQAALSSQRMITDSIGRASHILSPKTSPDCCHRFEHLKRGTELTVPKVYDICSLNVLILTL